MSGAVEKVANATQNFFDLEDKLPFGKYEYYTGSKGPTTRLAGSTKIPSFRKNKEKEVANWKEYYGIDQSKDPVPVVPPPLPMPLPDDETAKAARRRSLMAQSRRMGRRATILTAAEGGGSETLG